MITEIIILAVCLPLIPIGDWLVKKAGIDDDNID